MKVTDKEHTEVLLQLGFSEEDFDRLKDAADDDIDDETLCVICFEGPREAVFTNCGHMKTCMTCASQLKTCTNGK
eukprot:TRINITY_DN4417_c0_g1_i1.p2 TRINITY_DN4417_c0_g1~~TRINITY_DN4417_c0_g1_i1.p2  ORF type:complete len:75 (+),score=17.94 TRINITY_DN4417_c0_g1_i1:507-731(+)